MLKKTICHSGLRKTPEDTTSEFHETLRPRQMRTTLYTGRPMRIFKTPYALEWEKDRREEMLEMQARRRRARSEMARGAGGFNF